MANIKLMHNVLKSPLLQDREPRTLDLLVMILFTFINSVMSVSWHLLMQLIHQKVFTSFALFGSNDGKRPATNQPSPLPRKKYAAYELKHCPPKPTYFCTTSTEQLAMLAKPFVPQRAVKNFMTWKQHINMQEDWKSVQKTCWLSVFIVETRKVSGEHYPPTTLHNILSSILRYM